MDRTIPAVILREALEQKAEEKAERLLRDRTWVYLMHWQDRGPTKVGVANNPLARLAQLQCGNPFVLRIADASGFLHSAHAFDVEAAVLHRLRGIAMAGEWLNASPGRIKETVDQVVRTLSLSAVPWERVKKPRRSAEKERAIAAMEEYRRVNEI